MKKTILVIGGNSVAGQSAIKAARSVHNYAQIISTTSGTTNIEGADQTITAVNLTKNDDALKKVIDSVQTRPHALIFCPAFGMVGYPASAASAEDVRNCLDFSVYPLLTLAEKLNPELTIGFSSYYRLESLMIAYGSMAYAKYVLEKLATENPKRMRMVRAGLFPSKSLRGISLLIQRGVQKETFAGATALKTGWKASGLSFPEYFVDFAQTREKEFLATKGIEYRPTTEKDLIKAIEMALVESQAITNVIGSHFWYENQLEDVPEFLTCNQPAYEQIASLVFPEEKAA
jgi:hypothetical protein